MYKTDTKNEAKWLRVTTLAIIKAECSIEITIWRAIEKVSYCYRNIGKN